MSTADGGPAFGGEIDELFVVQDHPEIEPWKFKRRVAGMSLRDFFAAQALITAMGSDNSKDEEQASEYATQIARRCYEIADAMLAEREK